MMEHLPKFLEDQFKKHNPRIRDAFLRSMQDIRNSSTLSEVEDAIERGQIDLVLERLNIEPQFMDEMSDVLRAAYIEAGRTLMSGLPEGSQLVIRFEGRNPRAESWAAERSSQFITEVIEDQKEAVRSVVSEGIAQGRGPRDTALEIVGRVNRATGRREGGIIGLTSAQTGYINNARAQLQSGDPEELRKYLSRSLRDRRYDSVVRRAIDAGRRIPQVQIERIIRSYSSRMQKHRGDVVARTETLTSLNAGRREGLEQLVERGEVPRDKIKKIWRATGDDRTRENHMLMNNQEVEGDQPFRTPMGYQLMFPGDSSMGAPPQETIQCRCWVEYKIDYLGMISG